MSEPALQYPDRVKITYDKNLQNSPRTAALCLHSSGSFQEFGQISNSAAPGNDNDHLLGLSS